MNIGLIEILIFGCPLAVVLIVVVYVVRWRRRTSAKTNEPDVPQQEK